MHEALLSDVVPDLGHITQKVLLDLIFLSYLLEALPIESSWNMTLTGILPVFLVCAFMHHVTCAMDTMDNTIFFFSKNHRHNGLLVLDLSVPPKHPDEF